MKSGSASQTDKKQRLQQYLNNPSPLKKSLLYKPDALAKGDPLLQGNSALLKASSILDKYKPVKQAARNSSQSARVATVRAPVIEPQKFELFEGPMGEKQRGESEEILSMLDRAIDQEALGGSQPDASPTLLFSSPANERNDLLEKAQALDSVVALAEGLRTQVLYLDSQLDRAKAVVKNYQLLCFRQQEELLMLRGARPARQRAQTPDASTLREPLAKHQSPLLKDQARAK